MAPFQTGDQSSHLPLNSTQWDTLGFPGGGITNFNYFEMPEGASILSLKTNVWENKNDIAKASTNTVLWMWKKILHNALLLPQAQVISAPTTAAHLDCGIQWLSCRVSPPTHDEERGTQFSDVVNAARTMAGQKESIHLKYYNTVVVAEQ